MPELHTLGAGAFFGTDEEGWRSSNFAGSGDCIEGVLRRMAEVQRIYTRMFLEGKVRHFCQTSTMAPINLHPVELYLYKPRSQSASASTSVVNGRTVTLHADLRDWEGSDYDDLFNTCLCPSGVRIRWCFNNPRRPKPAGEVTPFLGYPERPAFAYAVYRSMLGGMANRHDQRDASPSPATFTRIPITADAYIPIEPPAAAIILRGAKVPSPWVLVPEEKAKSKKRAVAQRLGDVLNKDIFQRGLEKKVLHPDDRSASTISGISRLARRADGFRWSRRLEGG